MRFPFAVFASRYRGGATRAEHRLTTDSQVAALNAGATTVALNVARGNAVVRDKVFTLSEGGVSVEVGMVWDSHAQQWHFAHAPRLALQQGLLHTLKQAVTDKIELTEADGQVVHYAFHAESGMYRTTRADASGYTFLKRQADGTWERRHPATGIRECFAADGRMTQRVWPTSEAITYRYKGEQGCVITLPSGRQLSYVSTKQNGAEFALTLTQPGEETQTQTLATYAFTHGSLVSRLHDTGNQVFETFYHHDRQEDQRHTLSILSRAQGTRQTLMFHEHALTQFAEGEPDQSDYRVWEIKRAQDGKTTTLFTPNGEPYVATCDERQRLVTFLQPAEPAPRKWTYGENARQQTEVRYQDQAGQMHVQQYEPITGQLVQAGLADHPAQHGTWYDTNDVESLTWGAVRATYEVNQGERRVACVILNAHRQPAYRVSAAGRVTRYVYEEKAPYRLAAKQAVTTQFFRPITSNTAADLPTLAQLDAFWAGLTSADKQACQVTGYGYDAYHRQNKVTRHANPREDGAGSNSPANVETTLTFDPLSRITGRIKPYGADKTSEECIAQDILDRVTYHAQGNSTKMTWHMYAPRRTETIHPNLLKEITELDGSGLPIKHTQRALGLGDRITQKERDANGALHTLTRGKQTEAREWRDGQGRLVFQIDADGTLHEFTYHARGELAAKRTYREPVTALTTLDFAALTAYTKAHRPAVGLYTYYDEHGHPAFEIKYKRVCGEDGKWHERAFIVQQQYRFGQRVKTIQYSQAFYPKLLRGLTYAELVQHVAELNDQKARETRYFYDADGLLVGQQVLATRKDGAQGYTTEYERNGVGAITQQRVYQTLTPMADTLAQARPANAAALTTQYAYDNLGRKVAEMDADGYLTAYIYYPDGTLAQQTRYTQSPFNLNLQGRPLVLPEPDHATDEVIEYVYDALQRCIRTTNRLTQLQTDVTYDANDQVTKRVLTDLQTQKQRLYQAQYNLFNEKIKEADARASEKQQWVVRDYHPETGLCLTETDELGRQTHYRYDSMRRPVLEIRPNGAVVTYQYDPITQQINRIYEYSQPVGNLNSLQANANLVETIRNWLGTAAPDGYWTQTEQTSLAALVTPSDHDRETTLTYDADGTVVERVYPNQRRERITLNAFNEVETLWQTVDALRNLAVLKTYDLRGNLLQTVTDQDGLAITTQQSGHDALNRPTATQDALGQCYTLSYQGLRQVTQTDQDDPLRLQITKQDALKRLASVTDWEGKNPIQHEYQGNQHTIVSPVAKERDVTEISNAFGEVEAHTVNGVTTTLARDVAGELAKTTYADGTSESNTRDVLGRAELIEDVSGKKTKIGYDDADQPNVLIDDVGGHQPLRTAVEHANDVFGEQDAILSPNLLITKTQTEQHGLKVTTITDPLNLKLTETRTQNLAGAMVRREQGDATHPNQYAEVIEPDVLNRPERVLLEGEPDANGQPTLVLLKENKWDAVGHLLEEKDAAGHIQRRVYDKRGNLRFQIDARGYVVEKIYDRNNREVTERRYTIALPAATLATLSSQTTPLALSALLQPTADDAIRQRFYDADGVLNAECHRVGQVDGKDRYAVTAFTVNGAKHVIGYSEYAELMTLDASGVTLAALQQTLQASPYANHPKNRHETYVRDVKGKMLFKRDAEGYLVEKIRDAAGRVVMLRRYAAKQAQLDLTQPIDTLRANIQRRTDDRDQFIVRDAFGKPRYEIDAAGYVIEHVYDNAQQEVKTVHYYRSLQTLSATVQANLMQVLRVGGVTRDHKQALALCANACAQIRDQKKDVCHINEYDKPGRLFKETDGEGYVKQYAPNALDLNEVVTDQRQQTWRTQYNRAKLPTVNTAPVATVAHTQFDSTTHTLVCDTKQLAVDTAHEYDPTTLTLARTIHAANIENQSSQIEHITDANHTAIGTQLLAVPVDDETVAVPDKMWRPEKTVNITHRSVLDYDNREVVVWNEANQPTFTAYDALGRRRFVVDPAGFVTEYQYAHAFSEETRIIHYANPLPIAELIATGGNTGFSESQLRSRVQAIANKDLDRQLELDYDRRGDKQSCTVEKTLQTGITHANDDPTVYDETNTTTWERNAFRELIAQRERIGSDTSTTLLTRWLRDAKGNAVATIDPLGHVTLATYGMQHIDPAKAGHILLEQTEYAQPILVDENTTLEQIQAMLTPFANDPTNRHVTYDYDRRLLVTKQARWSGEPYYHETLNAANELVTQDLGPRLETITRYNELGLPAVIEVTGLGKRYIQYNALGLPEYETEFPLQLAAENTADGQPFYHIPVVRHLYNAHGKPVGTVMYANSATVTFKNDLPVISVTEDKAHDRVELVELSQRGDKLAVQDQNGALQFTSNDEFGVPVRTYKWVSGVDKQGQLVRGKHLRMLQTFFNERRLPAFTRTTDGDQQIETHQQFNPFQEPVAAGPSADQMVVFHERDKRGFPWLTNEDGNIPTISFPDRHGEPATIFRSMSINLLDKYRGKQADAARDLLQKSYELTYRQVQRTQVKRDALANVVQQSKPWYRKRRADQPRNLVMSFWFETNVEGLPPGEYVLWEQPSDVKLRAKFNLRRQGDAESQTRDEIAVPVSAKHPKNNLRCIPLDGLLSGMYDYEVDFHEVVDDKETLSHRPRARARGSVAMVFADPVSSNQQLWYMQDDHTLLVTGVADDIVGVELCRNGESVKRVAGTNRCDGRLIVDLSAVPSNQYEFRLLQRGELVTKVQLVPQGYDDGKMKVKVYRPQFHIVYYRDQPLSTRVRPDSFPPEVNLENVVYQEAIKAIPDRLVHMRRKGGWFDWAKCDPTYGANLFAVGRGPERYFLGQFVPKVPWQIDTTSCYPHTNVKKTYPPFDGNPYLHVMLSEQKTTLAGEIDQEPTPAVQMWCDDKLWGTFQMEPWANASAILPLSKLERELPVNVLVAPIDLSNTKSQPMLGRIRVVTAVQSAFVLEELSINNLNVSHYMIGPGNFNTKHKFDLGNTYVYARYDWQSNIKGAYNLVTTDAGVTTTLLDLSQQSRSAMNRPLHFQHKFNGNDEPGVLPISLRLKYKEDELALITNFTGLTRRFNNEDTEYLDSFDGPEVFIRADRISETTYPDIHVLYLSKLPTGTVTLEVQHQSATTSDSSTWETLQASELQRTQLGAVIPLVNMPAGTRRFRMRALDQDNNPIEVKGLQQDQENWFTQTITIKKGEANSRTFVSNNEEEDLVLAKPVANTKPDRWGNPLSVTDYKGNETLNAFNQDNALVCSQSPATSATDATGKTFEKVRLEHRFKLNTRNQAVATVQPNGGESKRLLSARGKPLLEQDADGVQNKQSFNVFDEQTSSTSPSGEIIRTTRESNSGITTETRSLPPLNGRPREEAFVKNEENQTLQHVLPHYVGTTPRTEADDYNSQGQNTLHVSPDGALQQSEFDLRTGTQLSDVDEDGNKREWALSADPKDAYHGITESYTDTSGMKTNFTRNQNKQLVSEIAEPLSEDTKRNRGHTKVPGKPDGSDAPPPKHIEYRQDEAGHTIRINDKAVLLMTDKSFDENDQCEAYYFLDSDGEELQVTHVSYDEVQRVKSLHDTRIILHLGYDHASNRRFARAFAYDINSDVIPLMRDSWHDYTAANRVILRDCISQNGKLLFGPDHGSAIQYEKGRVSQIRKQTANGGVEATDVEYAPGTDTYIGHNTRRESDNKLVSSERRELDAEGRTEQRDTLRQVDGKDSKEKEKTTFHPTSGHVQKMIRKLEGREITRETLEETKSGIPLIEQEKTTLEIDKESVDVIDTYKSSLFYADSAQVGQVTLDRQVAENHRVRVDGLLPHAEVNTTQNANGQYATVEGTLNERPSGQSASYRKFVVNSDNCVVMKEGAGGKRNFYFYSEHHQGQHMLFAYFGDLSEELLQSMRAGKLVRDEYHPAVINIDVNHRALSSQFPPPMSSSYVVPHSMTYAELAEDINYNGYGAEIAHANNATIDTPIVAGTRVTIPPLVYEVPAVAENRYVPSVQELLGSLYPSLPMPRITLKPKKAKFFQIFLEVAVMAAAMATGVGATLGMGMLAMMVGAAAGAAVGSTADQLIAMGYGTQQKFDPRQVAVSSILAAVSAGVANYVAGTTLVATMANSGTMGAMAAGAITASAAATTQQATLMAIHQQSRPDWKGLEIAAFAGAVQGGTNSLARQAASSRSVNGVAANANAEGNFTSPIGAAAGNAFCTLMSSVGESAIRGQRIDWQSIAASVAGSAAGNAAGDAAGRKLYDYRTAREQRQAASASAKSQTEAQQRTAAQRKQASKQALKQHDRMSAHTAAVKGRARHGLFAGARPQGHSVVDELMLKAQASAAPSGESYSFYDQASLLEKGLMFGAGAVAATQVVPAAILAGASSTANIYLLGGMAETSMLEAMVPAAAEYAGAVAPEVVAASAVGATVADAKVLERVGVFGGDLSFNKLLSGSFADTHVLQAGSSLNDVRLSTPVTTIENLLENRQIPGQLGVTLDQRYVNFNSLWSLTELHDGIEFCLTKEIIGDRNLFRLYAGNSNQVLIPDLPGIRILGHTHPLGEIQALPSFADINTLNKLYEKKLALNPIAPRAPSRIIWGSQADNITLFYPTMRNVFLDEYKKYQLKRLGL